MLTSACALLSAYGIIGYCRLKEPRQSWSYCMDALATLLRHPSKRRGFFLFVCFVLFCFCFFFLFVCLFFVVVVAFFAWRLFFCFKCKCFVLIDHILLETICLFSFFSLCFVLKYLQKKLNLRPNCLLWRKTKIFDFFTPMNRIKLFCAQVVTTKGFTLNHNKSLQSFFFCVKRQVKNDFPKDVESTVIWFSLSAQDTTVIFSFVHQNALNSINLVQLIYTLFLSCREKKRKFIPPVTAVYGDITEKCKEGL